MRYRPTRTEARQTKELARAREAKVRDDAKWRGNQS
jgi:hypothetical protein